MVCTLDHVLCLGTNKQQWFAEVDLGSEHCACTDDQQLQDNSGYTTRIRSVRALPVPKVCGTNLDGGISAHSQTAQYQGVVGHGRRGSAQVQSTVVT